jgi:hypothetical protein
VGWQITKKMIRVNKAVRNRREWIKFGDCEGQDHGFKETGVVNIAEPVSFELAGQVQMKMKMSSCMCVCSYIYLMPSWIFLVIPLSVIFLHRRRPRRKRAQRALEIC